MYDIIIRKLRFCPFLVSSFLLSVTTCFILVSSAQGSIGIFLDWEATETDVVQVGEAPADAPDRERIAKRAAIASAIQSVVGEEVKTQTVTSDISSAYDRVFTKKSGFVKQVRKEGDSVIKDGKFFQKYSMIVSPPDLDKALLESSLEQRIDIPAIYDMIESPRIAMAITETVVDQQGKVLARDPDLHSESSIQAYFKGKNPNFYFISMPSLGSSIHEKPDWVALGKKNNFDVIITGEIRTSFLLKVEKKIHGTGKSISIPMYRYSSELTWNIINIARSEREITVHKLFDQGSAKAGTSEVSAQGFAKKKVLAEAVPDLFRDLMLNWVEAVYYSPYEFVFQQTQADQDNLIFAKLRKLRVVVPESLHSRGSMAGKLRYNLRVQGTLGELSSALNENFPEYTITESRTGKVVLSPMKSKPLVFELKISNCSFVSSQHFLEKLKDMQGVWKVTEPTLTAGVALYTITSSVPVKEIAMQLESVLPVMITTIDKKSIQAQKQ